MDELDIKLKDYFLAFNNKEYEIVISEVMDSFHIYGDLVNKEDPSDTIDFGFNAAFNSLAEFLTEEFEGSKFGKYF